MTNLDGFGVPNFSTVQTMTAATRATAANLAGIPGILDNLRVLAANNSVIGQFVTALDAGITYRVDGQPAFGTAGTTANYLLTPQANLLPRPYLTPTLDGMGYTLTTSLNAQTLTPTLDGLGVRVS
jgi:hypothetical protein